MPNPHFESMSDAEVLAVIQPIMDNLMDASTRIDHEEHTRDFTDRLRSIVTPEHLTNVCERYQAERGYFAERSVVDVIRRPNALAVLWKQRFTKAPGEFVAEALFVETDGRCLVDHVMVW